MVVWLCIGTSLPRCEDHHTDLFSAFSLAAISYDSTALITISRQTDALLARNDNNAPILLLAGLVAWRLELIAFCKGDNEQISKYGLLTIGFLEKAEKGGADRYLAITHRAFACQLMATLGIRGGTKYGPRAAAELKKAKEVNGTGYYTRLVEAINFNQAPSFAGGNPAKALELLQNLRAEYPDSTDVKIHLADSLRKNKKSDAAATEILPVVKSNPRNLLAQKILKNIKNELSD